MEKFPLPHSEECRMTSSVEPSEETPRLASHTSLPPFISSSNLSLTPSSCPLLLCFAAKLHLLKFRADFLAHRPSPISPFYLYTLGLGFWN